NEVFDAIRAEHAEHRREAGGVDAAVTIDGNGPELRRVGRHRGERSAAGRERNRIGEVVRLQPAVERGDERDVAEAGQIAGAALNVERAERATRSARGEPQLELACRGDAAVG